MPIYRDYIDNVHDYNETYRLYENYKANGDTANATALAIQLNTQFRKLNASYADMRTSSLASMDMLDNTNQQNVNSSLLLPFLGTADSLMTVYTTQDHSIRAQSSDCNLTLTAASSEAHVGDTVLYIATLQSATNSPIGGANVVLYVNDTFVASAVTDASGTCQIPYNVSTDLTRDRVSVYSEYTPMGQAILPASSDTLYLHVLDENSTLSLSVSPHTATFGDAIAATGRLASDRGFPVRSGLVDVYLNGSLLGVATTRTDGTYNFSFNVNERTPGGQSNIYAVHDRAAGSFYLGASSPSDTLYVIPQKTAITMQVTGSRFVAGSTAPINGTLTADNGIPVADVGVVAYLDDRRIGNAVTDISGNYSIKAMIPYDSSGGNHSIYTAYYPANSSLYASSSDHDAIRVDSVTSLIAVNGTPLILFLNDTLSVTGSMHTSDGKPMHDQAVGVQVSDSLGGTVTTDDSGYFDYSRTVNAYDPAGIYAVSVFMQTPSGPVKSASANAGYVIVLPIDKTLALVAFVVDLALVILAILMLWSGLTMSRLIDLATGRSKQEADLEDMPPEPISDKLPPEQAKTQQSFEELASGIDKSIASGDFTIASVHMYTAARSLAINKGLQVADSDTHREFYRGAARAYPQIATPLGNIVNVYERMSYGHGDAGADDLKNAYNGLKEIFLAFKVAGATGQ